MHRRENIWKYLKCIKYFAVFLVLGDKLRLGNSDGDRRTALHIVYQFQHTSALYTTPMSQIAPASSPRIKTSNYSCCRSECRALSKLEAARVTSFLVALLCGVDNVHGRPPLLRIISADELSRFFSPDGAAARASLTRTYTAQSTLNQADMCSAQPVITRALMWSPGAAEASYYCRFMTTLTQTLRPTVPSSSACARSHYAKPHPFVCCSSHNSHAAWGIWRTWRRACLNSQSWKMYRVQGEMFSN